MKTTESVMAIEEFIIRIITFQPPKSSNKVKIIGPLLGTSEQPSSASRVSPRGRPKDASHRKGSIDHDWSKKAFEPSGAEER